MQHLNGVNCLSSTPGIAGQGGKIRTILGHCRLMVTHSKWLGDLIWGHDPVVRITAAAAGLVLWRMPV